MRQFRTCTINENMRCIIIDNKINKHCISYVMVQKLKLTTKVPNLYKVGWIKMILKQFPHALV